ncbi:MAG: tetratricopeptide repeat protein [Candidatus Omnitrophica bacterium]|nr:tetratricopeptide repeat protein [Candidatus Omnitrophota bacterium]
MKKTVFILIAILVVVYAGLSFLCRGGEYPAERMLYRGFRAANAIVINPDVAPAAMVASVENDLKSVAVKYPKTRAAITSQMTLAKFYAANKKYDIALATLDGIIAKEGRDLVLVSEALLTKGSIYEVRNQWPKALEEYKKMRDEYPLTPLGMQIPLYIGNHYRQNADIAEADAAYQDAVAFYKRIAEKNKGSEVGYVASNFLTQAYINLKRYEEAGESIENTIANYPSVFTYMKQLPAADYIYVKLLNNPAKAIAVYKQVREKTNDAKFSKLIQARIAELEKK